MWSYQFVDGLYDYAIASAMFQVQHTATSRTYSDISIYIKRLYANEIRPSVMDKKVMMTDRVNKNHNFCQKRNS